MKDSEKIRILDDMILSLEVASEKAAVMINTLDQDYFSLNRDCDKLYFFDKAVIQNEILLDYVFQIGDKLGEARKMLREWREDEKKEQ